MRKKNTFFIVFLLFLTAASGCVRVTGGAGYSYQGPGDEAPKTKSVGFDTQKLLPSGQPEGSIEMAEGT